MRAEIKKLDEYTRQITFVCKNNIDTKADLLEYKKNAQSKLHSVLIKRDNLYGRRQKASTQEEKEYITEQISNLTQELASLRYNIKLCEIIKEKTPEMQKNLKEMEIAKANVKSADKNRYCR